MKLEIRYPTLDDSPYFVSLRRIMPDERLYRVHLIFIFVALDKLQLSFPDVGHKHPYDSECT